MEWYHTTTRKCADLLHTDSQKGLSTQEARQRLNPYGRNVLQQKKKAGILRKFLSQFADFMVLILLAAAGISFVTAWFSEGDFTDPIMILLIVILNAVVGTVQECRAENAIAALQKLSAPHAKVIRNGRLQTIPSEELVPGDLLQVETGDLVCADARIIESTALSAEEAALTGESVPADKQEALLPPDTPLAEQANMLFSSTIITSGHGRAIVTATGMQTKVGGIAAMIAQEETPPTPLQKSLAKTGKWLGIAALGICAVIFVLGMLQHIPPLEMFLIAISLAVAAIPEGLPAVVTIVLALGVRKMALHRAIVRHLPAVETLGSTTVICSDKTGTLTQNRMTVKALTAGADTVSAHSSAGQKLLTLAALCCNSTLTKTSDGYTAAGNPTEKAILLAAAEQSLEKASLDSRYPRISETPFDSLRKRMATVHTLPTGGYRVILKGAPDILLSLCTHEQRETGQLPLNSRTRTAILAANDRLAAQAMRVIGVAYKDCAARPAPDTQEKGLIFCGLIGMIDPPRPQAKAAVQRCQKAGIRPVMITGDSPVTAGAIAAALGIDKGCNKVMTGSELDSLSQEELIRRLDSCTVFARVTPEHKVRIVKAFQHKGAVVAMTGDGVNDAPALRCADIGCAMGLSGTEAAKGAADMVLTDDNFATIVEAVEQGRGIFRNIRRTIHFLLSCNIGEILTVLCAFLLKLPTPLLAMQLLWINLITDSMPALALGIEPVEDGIMEQPPIRTDHGIFSKTMVRNMILEGCFIGAVAFLAFTIGRIFFDGTGEPVIARTMTLAVLSTSQLFHAFNLRSRQSHSAGHRGFSLHPPLLAALLIGLFLQAAVISLPFLSGFFHTVPLSPLQWLLVTLLSLSVLLLFPLTAEYPRQRALPVTP